MSEQPSDEQVEVAVKLGYIGLVSHRDTIQEAYDYAAEFAKSDDSSLVPVHVVMNTMALQWAQERLDAIEMCEAIKSYCEDDSRSPRRKQAILGGANILLRLLKGEK
ncbi:hypothetical protein LCGC14_2101700 [marine sediment metagenome]|uniref:Uncharacterized protein n=1 Tax=marine sediment metagenome TaxID=412755 RepID=A0A0F9E9N2_9ZZZZ